MKSGRRGGAQAGALLALLALVAAAGALLQIPASRAAGAATPAACVDGSAGGFPCQGVDLLAQIPLGGFSSNPARANDVWGFVDLNDGREYAIVGLGNGTAVVDVTDPVNPVEVGTIAGLTTVWRDIKVQQFFDSGAGRWKAYAYVTADGVVQGLQIIDLTQLPASVSLAATYTGFDRAHNLQISNVADYATGEILPGRTPYAFISGSNLNGGSFRILDLSDPVNPVEVTAPPPGARDSHDTASLLVSDARAGACGAGHNPCEVLIDYGSNAIDLWDVTNKAAPVFLSSTTYPNLGFVHSGWPSENGLFLTVHDELDEQNFALNTTLRAFSLANLAAPALADTFTGPTRAVDHNGFAHGGLYYISNYERGLTVLDFTDPTNPREVAFFDTLPASNDPNFNGAWGVYPFLPSGTVLVSDIQGGLFVLRLVENPTPALTSVSPMSAEAGGAGFTLTAQGMDFAAGAVVQVNGSNRTTTFISDTQLTAQIPASDLATGGTREVAVVNPVPGGGVSNSSSFTVTSYTVGATPMSRTVSAGQSASYDLTVAPQSGAFNAAVSFACSGLPALAACSFNPAQVTPGSNPANSTLTITTTAPTVAQAPPAGGPFYALWLGLLGLALLLLTALGQGRASRSEAETLSKTLSNVEGSPPKGARPKRRQNTGALAPEVPGAVLLLLLALLGACGGGSTEVRVVSRPGTPPGSHSITVTATSGSFQQTTTVTLVVQ
jgi:choice-of-anchor B domain-containing protein